MPSHRLPDLGFDRQLRGSFECLPVHRRNRRKLESGRLDVPCDNGTALLPLNQRQFVLRDNG